MKPQDRLHRTPRIVGDPMSGADRPPLLLRQLGQGARIRLVCGACTWSKAYDAQKVMARLRETGADAVTRTIADVARHIQWPCPSCHRMSWTTTPAGRDLGH